MKIIEKSAREVMVGDVIHSWGKVTRIELDVLPSKLSGRTFYNDNPGDWYSILDIGTVDIDVESA
jgi:hypothetical protein